MYKKNRQKRYTVLLNQIDNSKVDNLNLLKDELIRLI